jgi:tetratricopeptide (TPR) repeat protein
LSGAEALAATVAENRDVLYLIAVAQRGLGRIPDALGTLERLARLHPGFSRAFQERGHCYVALRDAPKAIDALLRAVNINPALPASWRLLHALFGMTGQTENLRMAAAHLEVLAKLPVEVITATGLFSDGDLIPAEKIIRAFLLKHGNHVEAMRLLARIGLELDVLDDADLLLERVLELSPDYTAARYDYARALLRRHKHAQAIAELDTLLALDPQNRNYRTTYATALVGLGDHARALEIYRQLLVGAAIPEELHLSIAHSLKTLGRRAEAVEAYRAAAAARPDFGDAYWSLANLKTFRFEAADINAMRAAESAPRIHPGDRLHLCFALGKALEDRGEFEESFQYYARGNAIKKSQSRYRPESVERAMRLQARICTPEFFAARTGSGCPAPDPIFIVGLPRSGSTLLEQILASHSAVEGTMELADLPRLVQDLQGREPDSGDPRYPRILADLAPEEFVKLGTTYLSDTRVYRSGKPFFIDKMPNNFRHVGLIHLMLPNAKIIDARREPMACCFSNFKQLFASGQEFTYDLEDLARYYRGYLDLMAHWNQALPGKVLRVQYEDVVQDLEGSVRRILEFCGLGFEAACVDFHKTMRSIRTASSEQVRQPIFKEGIDQWRHFEPWLETLQNALGAALPPS